MATPRPSTPRADRRRTIATLLGVALALGVLLSVGLMAGAPEHGRTGGVELLVYSGRPNPSFELTAAEVDDLVRQLAALPPGAPGVEAPGLGYRGLTVTLTGGGLDRMTVYGGAVRLETADGVDTRLDTTDVENWLLALARQRGYADLLASLGR
jgi:hypothetical protein